MDDYKDFIAATKILDNLALQIYREEGFSPAWEFLTHAKHVTIDYANKALRSQD